jgi:hypothetical protein
MAKDSLNPYTVNTANDKGAELTQLVINWYRGNRNSLNSAQQTAVINAITSILNNTFRV